jgi:hypothetical protein
MLKYIVEKHAERLGVDKEKAYGHAMLFSILVGIMENNGKLQGSNPNSSAKGLYQFIAGSVGPAVNRLKRIVGHAPWMDDVLEHKDTGRLSWEQQTALFLGDMLEKAGSDYLMEQVLRHGDPNSMIQAYYILHHTNPDEATKRRAHRVFYGT